VAAGVNGIARLPLGHPFCSSLRMQPACDDRRLMFSLPLLSPHMDVLLVPLLFSFAPVRAINALEDPPWKNHYIHLRPRARRRPRRRRGRRRGRRRAAIVITLPNLIFISPPPPWPPRPCWLAGSRSPVGVRPSCVPVLLLLLARRLAGQQRDLSLNPAEPSGERRGASCICVFFVFLLLPLLSPRPGGGHGPITSRVMDSPEQANQHQPKREPVVVGVVVVGGGPFPLEENFPSSHLDVSPALGGLRGAADQRHGEDGNQRSLPRGSLAKERRRSSRLTMDGGLALGTIYSRRRWTSSR